MNVFKIILLSILGIGLMIGLSYGFGWIGVHQTSTIGKAQKNANREVYEESNSFVTGKRQEAIKYFKEWSECDTEADKEAIEYVASMSLSDFNEDKYINDIKLLNWIKSIKY